ncbi:increased rDNA silencing protein [Apiospora arundinis]|uniref:Increased rDNA silencing protein n=1 Tax=Apiospora arundinis TaxID=335852 RepID=A0ABR2J4U9_9PEZI
MHHPPGTPTGRLLPPNSPAAATSPSTRDGGGGGNAAYSAALRGASLAFQRTTPQPTPRSSPRQQQRSTNTKDDGYNDSEALIAATSASREHSLSRASPTRAAAGRNSAIHSNNTGRISRQTTGSSSVAGGEGNYGRDNEQGYGGHNNNNNNNQQRPTQRSATPQKQQQQQNLYPNNTGAPSLKPPGLSPMGPDPRSPSFIAATLAASRSASPSRREQQQQSNTAAQAANSTTQQHHPYAQQAATKVRRKQSTAGAGSHSAASSVTDLDLTDTTPIPPTNSLISMFEKKDPAVGSNTDPVKKTTGPDSAKKPAPKIRPITPPRALDTHVAKPEVLSPSMLASTLAWEQATSPPASASGTKVEASPSASQANRLEGKKRPPTPPVKSRKPVGSGAKVPEPEDAGTGRKPRAATPPRPAGKPETVILSPRPRRAASHKMILRNDMAPEAEGKTGGQEGIDQKMLPESMNPGPRPSSVKTLPAKTTRVVNKLQPRPPRPRRSSSTSSKDTFVSASSGSSPTPASPRNRLSRPSSPKSPAVRSPRRPASVQSLPAHPPSHRKPIPPPAPPRRLQPQPNIALASLTNATMAGILASSRASPSAASPTPPVLPPRNQPPHMRQTLRQPPKSDDEEEKDHKHRHKKKHLSNKKKHAHHEGARRRWREQITERERKRYEGVWASNRGLLLTPSSFPSTINHPPGEVHSHANTHATASASTGNLPLRPSYNDKSRTNSASSLSPAAGSTPNPNPADFVANVVARDIWSRSRLPFDELAEVWDLVDSRGVGALDKTEFVVGMWLIDQRLRGRKIPQKVSESVWFSAKGVGKVPAPPAERRKGKKK